jgi:DNA-binding CsgD family transcriptional regulator
MESNDRRITQADILALLRLSNHLHELPINPIIRHEHMLTELCSMIGATFGISALLDTRPTLQPSLLFLVYHGFDDPERQSKVYQCVRSMEDVAARPLSLMQLLGLSKPLGTNGIGMNGFAVDVPRRIRQPHGNDELQLGNSVTSMIEVGRNPLRSVLSFHRSRNDRRPFNLRDRRVVRLFHSQMEWMFSDQLPHEAASTFDSLTPRQQQTLRYLLSGDSEKQIANKLARSPHTVHTHVKGIYRNLGVSSRGELLSLFVR